MEINFVKASVINYHPELSLKINIGDRHRVMKKGWRGSIWITSRDSGYRIHITGKAEKYLCEEIELAHGKCNGYDIGYPYWYLNNVRDIEEIIKSYANKRLPDNVTRNEFISIANNKLNTRLKDISETERETLINSRIGQNVLRELIIEAYNNSCAMCNINDSRLLRASHIVKWSEDETNRLNPNNVLCLCSLHDLAFENGIIFISDKFNITINSKSYAVSSLLKKITFTNLKLPINKNLFPDKKLLKKHRNKYSNAL